MNDTEVMDIISRRVEKALKVISKHTKLSPTTGVILGSGQGGFSNRLKGADYYPYRKIPFFFQPIVPGHEGILSVGELDGKHIAVLEGRIHLYEGYFMREIVFPVRVLHGMGVRNIIICNAAGGLNSKFRVGQVMVVADHINLMGTNPLVGQIHQMNGSPFLSMAGAYDPRLRAIAKKAGMELGDALEEGILAAVSGPCYETAAESHMLAFLGADAVTMSTIPEVIMAHFLKMNILCLSLITNIHDRESTADHRDVLTVAHRRTEFFMELISRIVTKI